MSIWDEVTGWEDGFTCTKQVRSWLVENRWKLTRGYLFPSEGGTALGEYFMHRGHMRLRMFVEV